MQIKVSKAIKLVSKSPKETKKIAGQLAGRLQPGDIICLFGDLGSGKTVFTQGLARGLGVGKAAVISPSFVLIREYPGAEFPLFHFDLYRLNSKSDIFALGYEEYLYAGGVSVIEWADRLNGFLPKEYLRVDLIIKARQERLLKISAHGARYKELLGRIDEDISR